jgi:hypothetical protein
MPMCLKRQGVARRGIRLYRLSKHEDISTDAQPPSTLNGRMLHSV